MTQEPHTAWRFALAERMARAYAENPKAEVVMVAGSVGRGTADAYSDVEIDVYYSAAPTESERVEAVRRCGAALDHLNEDEVEWEEQMSFSGFPAATSTFLSSTMETFLDRVVDAGDPDPEAQVRLFSLLNAETVVGESKVERWRARARRYPDSLQLLTLKQSLQFGSLFRNVDMLLARNDVTGLYDGMLDCQKRIVRAILALNRTYLPTPEPIPKLDEVIAGMEVKPKDLSARLKQVLLDEPHTGVERLEKVIHEVLELVAGRVSGLSLDWESCGLMRVRREWDVPPLKAI